MFGMGVDDNETSVHHLNKFGKSSSNSFINLGKPGLSTKQLIHHYLNLEKKYNVIVAPNGGDLKDKIFRVSHMGDITKKYTDIFLYLNLTF